MAPHKPRKSSSIQDTDDEDMIVYDMAEQIESPKKKMINTFVGRILEERVLETGGFLHVITPTRCIKRNSRNRRKRPKVQKAEIEIKMAPHRLRKSAPTELATDDEDMIMYDVQAEELERNPEDKFAMTECFVNNPSEFRKLKETPVQCAFVFSRVYDDSASEKIELRMCAAQTYSRYKRPTDKRSKKDRR
ncbi:hypothetical protein TNCV_4051241 [Trichonephila clavipes]|nr:hypothetical protein TNCV_4051241 [Trichonephila clavipes]